MAIVNRIGFGTSDRIKTDSISDGDYWNASNYPTELDRPGYSDDSEYYDPDLDRSDYCTPALPTTIMHGTGLGNVTMRTDITMDEHALLMAIRALNKANDLVATANAIALGANNDVEDAEWEQMDAVDAYSLALKSVKPGSSE